MISVEQTGPDYWDRSHVECEIMIMGEMVRGIRTVGSDRLLNAPRGLEVDYGNAVDAANYLNSFLGWYDDDFYDNRDDVDSHTALRHLMPILRHILEDMWMWLVSDDGQGGALHQRIRFLIDYLDLWIARDFRPTRADVSK